MASPEDRPRGCIISQMERSGYVYEMCSGMKGMKGGRRVCFPNPSSQFQEVFLCNVKKTVLD